jgi:DNA topoisomerase IB
MHVATHTVTSNSRPHFARVATSLPEARKRAAPKKRGRAKPADPPEAQAAADAGLRYVVDAEPGLRRRRAGKGFMYLDAKGRHVTDATAIARIRALAIPPAWTDVWICKDARGHLQACGRDARGRKQYRYHAKWRRTRDAGKFARLAAFGQRLPKLRRRLARDLKGEGLPRGKVLAIVVSLLAETLIRVGNHEYARSNNSFGLTTLKDRHVRFPRGDCAIFRFRGKSGQEHTVELEDARLAALLRRCQQLPGQALFQYVDEAGRTQPVDSGAVNGYLRAAMCEDFTAKDFRTWGGTLEAIAAFVRTPRPRRRTKAALARAQGAAVKQVAAELGNTPAVCRGSYIHPAVFAGWRSGALQRAVPKSDLGFPRKMEKLALAFLANATTH